MEMNIPGLVAIIIFYLIILAIGIYAARRQKKKLNSLSDGEFDVAVLAGRDIGLCVGCFTMTATFVGGGFINGTAESIYTSGLVWSQATWCYSVCLICVGLFFAKKMREKNYTTMMDPLQERFGERIGALLYIPSLLGDTFYTASILNALGATFGVVMQIDVDIGVTISAIIAVSYTLLGGLISVAYTDIVQLICIFVGLWITVPFAMKHKHVTQLSSTSEQWLGTWNVKHTGLWIDYALLMMFGGIPLQATFQRVLSARSSHYAQKILLIASFGLLLMVIPAFILGAVAKSTDWPLVAPHRILTANGTIADTRFVLPMVLQYLTPTWVSFFGLGAISAAVMSSTDSAIFALSSLFANNIYKILFRPKASCKELLWVLRVCVIIAGIIATVTARTVKSVYALFVISVDLVYVVLFPQFVAAIYIPNVNGYGSITAYVIGLILRFGGGENLIGMKPFIKYPLYQSEDMTQLFPFRTFGMIVSFIVLVAVSWASKYLFEKEILPLKYDFLQVFPKQEDKRERNTHVDLQVHGTINRAINVEKQPTYYQEAKM